RDYGPSSRRLRLCAGSRPHRDGRHVRPAAREGRHQGVLPRHQGREHPRHPPLEATEDVAMTAPGPAGIVKGQDTLPRLFRQAVKERGEQVAMREKSLGIWRSITWREYGEGVRRVALGLVALGLRRGDVVSIVADNRPECLYTDLGTISAGGVTNGIYTTDSPRQVEYIVNDSGTRLFFAGDAEQLDKKR